ncbi:very-long-chain enoyl-CoA reductase-like [Patiria miniata]|uniref:3-oxo-5-alpha-steroid 4-dehydrogenase C-terminal domain-containing protein n=1 Tax=Patiria miniata TaxID=46514 RepID=A0A914ATH4_PATMI|nr:very-long-chain enoyl-CoA reductase-like [Patiria miniata]
MPKQSRRRKMAEPAISSDEGRESDPINVNRPSAAAQTTKGFNAVVVNSGFYIGTIVSFLLASLVPGLPKLPFPVIGCMVTANSGSFGRWQPGGQVILMVLYVGHFIRRTAEVLFVHRYKRKMPLGETLGAPVYYWTFGFWAGWALRPDLGYINTHVALFVAGAIIFIAGEVGNCAAHIQLRRLRGGDRKREGQQAPPSGHVIPRGVLFSLVSCPHYTSEIISWVGFFLATWTLNGALFLLATVITLIFYSTKHHRRYKEEFDGRDGRELYPTCRKALIPFIF